MKQTPLYKVHVDSGARIVEFAGYEMPVQYSSILEEHMAVRNAAGLFDVSHMGEIVVKGPESKRYLENLIPTSMSKLEKGKGMYSVFCNPHGGVIDDLFIFMVEKGHYFLVVNAATTLKDFSWMERHLIDGVTIEDISCDTAKIDIQGPASGEIMKKIFSDDSIEKLERFRFHYDRYSGSAIMISATGYTGEAGYELFIHNSKAEELWNTLIAEGTCYGLIPAGLGARDTLRLEACYSLYGHELNESINPVEAGIGWLISSDADYIGKDELIQLKSGGNTRVQIAVQLTDKGIPREKCEVIFNGNRIGYVTSGAFSPLLKKGIALCLVEKNTVSSGDIVEIIIRDKGVKAQVVKKPFYAYNG
ncbi:MAG TPA: glycine cleavage system aminomethyltransferase GcvT [Spirochaetota bacterium]|nr:glycine cleavage system aminomethyltransferase GcvT [Spirochaetota bacterium]HPJ34455.1 glycine cleavage system aminomethyltransferase GcvT [Spirochaetota bacterium]